MSGLFLKICLNEKTLSFQSGEEQLYMSTPTTKVMPYANEPFTNFAQEDNMKAMQAAIVKVKGEFGREYPLYIGSEKVMTEAKITSINPGNVDEVIGYVSKADQDLAEKAMNVALETFESWKKVPARERAEYLFKAAALMRARKHEFSALMILSPAKTT